jgi:hypothetical protein
LHEHARRGLFTARPELAEGIGYFIVSPVDMMKIKTVKILLELSYLLAVCCLAGVMAV